jgi:hypothetical protein
MAGYLMIYTWTARSSVISQVYKVEQDSTFNSHQHKQPSLHLPSISRDTLRKLHRSSLISTYQKMLFSNVLLSSFASAAAALTARQVTTEYAPWEITAVSAARGGRPNSDPNATLNINIKQPNTIKLQRVPRGYAGLPAFEASCDFTWRKIEALPIGEVICITMGDSSAYGNFSMAVTGISLDDFSVAIKESRDITIFQQQYIRVFEGEQAFKRDDGVWRIRCSAGGQCNWSAGGLPLEVKQNLTTSVGSCEEATTGSC